MSIIRVYLSVDEQKFEVPQWIILSSKVIKYITEEYNVISEITFNPSLIIECVNDINSNIPSQYIIPVLDFLECDNLIKIATPIIVRTSKLDPLIKRLLYGIPVLAYQAYLRGLMLSSELPPYSSEVPRIRMEDIGYDMNKAIELINLGFSARRILGSRYDNKDLYDELYGQIDRINPDRLEYLAREDLLSKEVLGRMVELRMINEIESIYGIMISSSMIKIIETNDEEMIDMLGRVCAHSNLVRFYILVNSLRLNNIYSIRYGPDDINEGISLMSPTDKLTISVNNFNEIADRFNANSLIKLTNMAGVSNNYDLVDAIIKRIPNEERPNPLDYCITSDFNSIEEYELYTGITPTPYNINIIHTLKSLRYGGLFKQFVTTSSLEYKMELLAIIIQLYQDVNLELIDYLVECVSRESLAQYIRDTVYRMEDQLVHYDPYPPRDIRGYYLHSILTRDENVTSHSQSENLVICRSSDIIIKYNNAIVEYAQVSLL